MLFLYLLRRIVRKGAMGIIPSDGKCHTIGNQRPHLAIRLHRKRLEMSLGLWPDTKIGEAYMDGTLTLEQGTLADFIRLLMVNYREARHQRIFRWLEYIGGRAAMLRQINPIKRAQECRIPLRFAG